MDMIIMKMNTCQEGLNTLNFLCCLSVFVSVCLPICVLLVLQHHLCTFISQVLPLAKFPQYEKEIHVVLSHKGGDTYDLHNYQSKSSCLKSYNH